MGDKREKAQRECEGEHGHGVDVDHAGLVSPVVGQHLREVADGWEEGRNSCYKMNILRKTY